MCVDHSSLSDHIHTTTAVPVEYDLIPRLDLKPHLLKIDALEGCFVQLFVCRTYWYYTAIDLLAYGIMTRYE